MGGPFGPPYVIQVRRDISFEDLRLLMLDTMAELFNDDYLVEGDVTRTDTRTDLNYGPNSPPQPVRNHTASRVDRERLDLLDGLDSDAVDNLHRFQEPQRPLAGRSPVLAACDRPIVPEFPSSSFSILCADMLPERNEIRGTDDLPLYTDPVEHITAVSKVNLP